MDRLQIKRAQIAHALADRPLEELTVCDVMTMAPRTVRGETSVLDLVRLLKTNGFRHLLVNDMADNLVGVLSDRDVIRCFGPNKYPDENKLARITAADIMSSDLITTGPQEPIQGGLAIMVAHGISCLPVVVGPKAVGILTNTDMHLLLEQILKLGRGAVSGPQNRHSPARA